MQNLTINNIGIIKGRESRRTETLLSDLKEQKEGLRIDIFLASVSNDYNLLDEIIDKIPFMQADRIIMRMFNELNIECDDLGKFGNYTDLLFDTIRKNFCIV